MLQQASLSVFLLSSAAQPPAACRLLRRIFKPVFGRNQFSLYPWEVESGAVDVLIALREVSLNTDPQLLSIKIHSHQTR